MSDLGALLTAIVTPFSPPAGDRLHGAVDEAAFVALQKKVIGRGSHGVVVCGTTGEASTLDDTEHLRVVELAVQNKPAGSTVIAGTGSNDTAHAVALTERATELGADAVLSVTPYYNRPNRRGLIRHYEEVAKATDKPIILYNIPNRAGLDVPNELLAELAQIDGIAAVKQANNDNLALIDGLELYAGNDDVLARTLELGGKGGICVASTVAGELMRRMIDEPAERDAINARLQPLFSALSVTPAAISAKAALKMMGDLEHDTVRLPYAEADDHERGVIAEGLRALGLIGDGAVA